MGSPNTNIFITGLPTDLDDDTLKNVFGAYGTVTWSKVMDGKGKPDKVAIVEFADVAEATWCVENLNGNIPQGLSVAVTVNYKMDKRDKGAGKGGFKGGKDSGKSWGFGGKGGGWNGGKDNGKSWGGGKDPWQNNNSWGKGGGKAPQAAAWSSPGKGESAPPGPNTNIYIQDLPAEVDDNMLAEIFGAYGTITWHKVMGGKGKPTNSGIVEFADIAEAQWCVENLNGNIPQGLTTAVQVTFKQSRPKFDKGGGKGWNGGGKDFGKGKGKGGGKWGPY